MIQAWQTFLKQQGAKIEQDQVVGFESATGQAGICPLNRWQLFRISGADAATFMQGQFSNDVRQLNGSNSQLSSYNSPKGRMYSCFVLFKHQENFYLRLPGEIAAQVIKRLRMFVMRSAVVIDDVSEQFVHLGIIGSTSELQHAGLPAPTDERGFQEHQGILILRAAGASPRFELFVPVDQAQTIWSQLTPHLSPAAEQQWELAEIRAGQPDIYQTTLEAFVPQMANLDLIGGISFNKGCYTGQEIVARTHYLGKQKKRMYLLRTSSTAVQTGDKLFEHNSDNTQSIGEIVRAATNEQGGQDFLAVMQIKSCQADLRLHSIEGEACTLLPQPYELPLGE
ncbi:MAG: folate-binding protein [Gammaproteobacteria bacterium]|nr:folate-binding protein [Gammaproteobacteria bacterium]